MSASLPPMGDGSDMMADQLGMNDGGNGGGDQSKKKKKQGITPSAKTLLRVGFRQVVDEETGEIIEYTCRFCENFGRTNDPKYDEGRKRKRRSTVYRLAASKWRADHPKKHSSEQHIDLFPKYQKLTVPEQEAFFDQNQGTMARYLRPRTENQPGVMLGQVDLEIVDDLIAKYFVRDMSNPRPYHDGDEDDDDEDDENEDDEDEDDEQRGGGRGGHMGGGGLNMHGTIIDVAGRGNLTQFKLYKPNHVIDPSTAEGCYYTLRSPSELVFNLACQTMARASSFGQARQTMHAHADRLGQKELAVTIPQLKDIVRMASATNFQVMKDMLARAWALSWSCELSAHMTTLFLDIRVRAFTGKAIEDVHVCAVPMRGPGSSSASFSASNLIADVFPTIATAICAEWKRKTIAVSCDGDHIITGKAGSFATLMNGAVFTSAGPASGPSATSLSGEVYYEWRGLHQLALAVKGLYVGGMDGQWLPMLTAVVGHLRRQQRAVGNMSLAGLPMCPTVVVGDLLSVGRALAWLATHRGRAIAHITSEAPEEFSPTAQWWVFTYFYHLMTTVIDPFLRKLLQQALNLTLHEQDSTLRDILVDVMEYFVIETTTTFSASLGGAGASAGGGNASMSAPGGDASGGVVLSAASASVARRLPPPVLPLEANAGAGSQDGVIISSDGTIKIHVDSLVGLLRTLPPNDFYQQSWRSLVHTNEQSQTISSVALQFVSFIAKVAPLRPFGTSHDNLSSAGSDLGGYVNELPCMPYQLHALSTNEFYDKVFLRHSARFQMAYGETCSTDLLLEHRRFKSPSLRFSETEEGRTKGFFEQWARYEKQFPMLFRFAGGLASVFHANVSHVATTAESGADFSMIKSAATSAKRASKTTLYGFSLLSILQCKQRQRLLEIERDLAVQVAEEDVTVSGVVRQAF